MQDTPGISSPKHLTAANWKKRLRLSVAILIPAVLLLALFVQMFREHQQTTRPSVRLDDRYLVRIEKMDVRKENLTYFQPTIWSFDFLRSAWRQLQTAPDYKSMSLFWEKYFSSRMHAETEHPRFFIYLTCFDEKLGRYVDIKAANLFSITGNDSLGETNYDFLGYSQPEEKNGKIVQRYISSFFNPNASYYYFTFSGRGESAERIRISNKDIPKKLDNTADVTAWLSQAKRVPVLQNVDGFEVVFTGLTPQGKGTGQEDIIIRRDGRDVGAQYEVVMQISNPWGFSLPIFSQILRGLSLSSPCLKISGVLRERENAHYPKERLLHLGKQKRPDPQTAKLLKGAWRGVEGEITRPYLLGAGRHFFARGRWLRSETIPETHGGYYPQEEHLSAMERDEKKNYAPVMAYTLNRPTLFLVSEMNMPVSVIEKVAEEGAKETRYNTKFGRCSLGLVQVQFQGFGKTEPPRFRSNLIFSLTWPEGEPEKEIVVTVPKRRDFEFFITPSEALKLHASGKVDFSPHQSHAEAWRRGED